MSDFQRPRGSIYYRHFGRYSEIVSVLVKYGFGDLLSRLNIERYVSVGRRIFRAKKKGVEKFSRWERIRMALEELGPTFVKLGQFASNRPDIFPQELITTLETLQDAVPPFSEQEALRIIEKELKTPVSALFKKFGTTPVASASIAQVNKAVLHDGTVVAVKVQRPRITEAISIDLHIMYHIARLLQKHIQGMDFFNPVQFVDEFASAINKELDFVTEALHFDHFRKNFGDDPTVYIPKVYHDLTTRKVLITEFINGVKITNIEELKRRRLDPREIAARGASSVLKQIFRHGFFHADPHPGNILILEGNVICLLDLGMTGILTPTSRGYLGDIIVGVANGDAHKIVRTLYEISNQQAKRGDELEYQIAELIQEYASRPLGAINVGEILNRLTQILMMHRLKLIPGFYLLVKALVTMEGIGYKLDPGFDMMKHIEPFARQLVREKLTPRRVAGYSLDALQDYFYLFRDLPSDSRDIFQIIKSGKFHMEIGHHGLGPFLNKIDQSTNRIVYGLVLASLVVGSSIVVLSDIPPRAFGMPVIGMGGFIAAGLMGFGLLISILKHGKM